LETERYSNSIVESPSEKTKKQRTGTQQTEARNHHRRLAVPSDEKRSHSLSPEATELAKAVAALQMATSGARFASARTSRIRITVESLWEGNWGANKKGNTE
jgi:hypothetical protein